MSKNWSRPIIPLLVALVCLWASPALSQDGDDFFMSDAPVEINADNINFDSAANTYHATGNVEINQGGAVLRCDSAVMDLAAGVATASGSVRIATDAGDTLTADVIQMDLKAKTAVVTRARIFYSEDNLHITAEELRKTGPRSYSTRKTSYTTCDCEEGENPAWSFKTSTATVTVGDFLAAWNARFYIKGVPAFYFPYARIPVKRERQSGMLQPGIGYSGLRGAALKNSFFWAISDNTDATFYLDAESQRGVGEGVEYRYIRTRKSFGELFFYHYSETDIDRVRAYREDVNNLSRPENASNERWQLVYDHTEIFGNGIKLQAKLNFISDDEYLIDFARAGEDRTLESIENNISLSKSWNAFTLVGQLRYFNNLIEPGDRTTLQRMPEITFSNSDKRILNTPLHISSESSFVYFLRKEGVTGQRLDVKPRLSVPMSPGGFDITPSVAPRATFYQIDNEPGVGYKDRYTYEISVNAATTFVRVFNPDEPGAQPFRHIIRPRLTYTYMPEVKQDDLPQFDSVDNIVSQNAFTYSLVSVLTGKESAVGAARAERDYAYFDLRQSYDIDEASRKIDPVVAGDKKRPFSDIRAEMILAPAAWADFSALAEYDVYEDRFDRYNTSLSARDKRGDSMNISYRYLRAEATEYMEGSARVRVIRPVDLTYRKRYSFDAGRALETAYGVEYTHQCWNASLTYTERLEEKAVFLTFSLKGLGKIAGLETKFEQF